ncbi:MAG: terminase large subunit [Cyclobacteriaceae bacterium]
MKDRLHDLAYIEIAKKNGKTTLCAILILIDCIIDNELNASVLAVAAAKGQAQD